MEQVEAAFRAAGITVPFTSNEKGERSMSWSTDYENVGGAVNVYGLDSYPGGITCKTPTVDFLLFETTSNGFQTTPIPSQAFSLSLREVISRPGVEASTIVVQQSMIRLLRISIIRIILARELPCKTCTWHGVGRTGDIVSRDLLRINASTNESSCRPCGLHFVRLLCSIERNEADPGQVVPDEAYWFVYKGIYRSSEDAYGGKWHWLCSESSLLFTLTQS